MKIFLIGPGGVGKSTCGNILAQKLQCKFMDLDKEFCNRIENISKYLDHKSYEEYCHENSQLFYDILNKLNGNFVFALSSGFLVYEDALLSKHIKTLNEQGTSILLLPSQSLEKSIEIIIKRQLARGFGLNEDGERKKFIDRFEKYKRFGNIQIFSYGKPEKIVELIMDKLPKNC